MPPFRYPAIASALVLLAACPALCQTSTAPTRDSAAVGSLQQALAALGGSTQPTPVSIVASGTYTRFAQGSPVTYPLQVEVLGTDKFRWQVDTPDQGTIVTIISGITGWRETSQGTQPIPIGQIPGTTFEAFPALAISLWANSSTVSATMDGPEAQGGESVLHLSLIPTLVGNADAHLETIYESTHKRELYLDQQTLLPARLRYYGHPTDSRLDVPTDLLFSDFRPVNGLLFPFTITRYVQGQSLATIEFQSITLDTTLNPSDFTVQVAQ